MMRVLKAQPARVRERCGVVPQQDNLDPDFTVVENLRVYARYFGINRRDAEARLPSLLEFASLTREIGPGEVKHPGATPKDRERYLKTRESVPAR